MAREIKTTIAVDGEAKFKKAISEASKSISNMGTELTLAAAQFKADGDAMKLMESRSKTLRKEIEQQKNIVKAMEGAVQDATKKYGENSQQVERWKAELNRAQAKLTNLNSELSNNQQGLDRNGKAFDSAGNKAQSAAGQVGNLSKAMGETSRAKFDYLAFSTAMDKLVSKAKTVAKVMINVGKGAWDMVAESAAWADSLKTEALVEGVDVETLQSWYYAARFVDTEVSDIFTDMDKVFDKATSGSKEAEESFRKLGVSIREGGEAGGKFGGGTEGQLRSRQDIFWDTIEALGRMTDGNEKNAAAMDLFGKKAKELNPLIKEGRAGWEKFCQEAKASGYVLDETAVDSLGGFDDSLQKLEASIEAAKNTLSVELAPAMKTIADAFTTLIDEFNAWAKSEEGQAALKGLSDAIASVVASLTGEVDFKALVEGATEVIKKLGEAFTWAAEHPEEVLNSVRDALKTIAGLTIGKTVLDFLTSLQAIGRPIGSLFSGITKLFGGTSSTGNDTNKWGVDLSKTGAAIRGGLKVAGTTVAETALFALPFALGIDGMIQDQQKMQEALKKGRLQADAYAATAGAYAGSSGMYDIWDALTKATSVTGTKDQGNLEQFAQHYMSWFNDEVTDTAMDQLTEAMTGDQYDRFHEAMLDVITGTHHYSSESMDGFIGALTDAAEKAEELLKDQPVKLPAELKPDISKLQMELNNSPFRVPVIFDYSRGLKLPGHANGLPYVPFDGYPALLHKGERVMTARENNYNNNSNLYVEKMYMNNGMDAQALASVIGAQQRRAMAGCGN